MVEMTMLIDTHVHFWELKRGDYFWLKPSNRTLYRDFTIDDWHRQPDTTQVAGCIAVQAAPTIAETHYLLALAEKHDKIVGVVGYLDLHAADFERQYERLRQHERFAGIRYTLNGSDTSSWEPDARLKQHLRRLEADQFPVDVLMKPANIPYLVNLLQIAPKLNVACNHLGSPVLTEQVHPDWSRGMAMLATYPNVMCKLSGMVTQMAAGNKGKEIVKDHVRQLMKRFGTRRLLFGSDWPVLLMRSSYEEMLKLFREVIGTSISQPQMDEMQYGNASRFYGLKRASLEAGGCDSGV